ncbi:MAG: ABC transporter substrate-binding protein [Snowella sp.]|nr:ABC transporter substrate-binding protein [Snowella sp.]
MQTSLSLRSLSLISLYLNRRAFLWQMAMGAGLAVSNGGCQQAQSVAHLRIGINDWIGYAIARYAQSSGILEKRGLQVDFIEFLNLQDATRAMLRGALDATFTTTWDLLHSGLPDEQPVILMVCDISNGADGIVARSPLKTMPDLKGKRVGVKLGTINELILLEALKQYDIPLQTIKIVDISNQIAANQLKKNLIDAAVLWQPLLTQTAKDIQGSILYTTQDQDSLVVDVLATRKAFFQQKQAVISRFLWAWFDTMAILQKTPAVIFESLAKTLGYSSVDLMQDYAGVKPGTLALNRQFFGQNQRMQKILKETLELSTFNSYHSHVVHQNLLIPNHFILQAIEQWQAPV